METQQTAKPIIRFPEFKDDWREFRLSELMYRVSKNNKDEEFSVKEILSLSSTQGIVDRKELLGDTYDKVNHKNYIKTRLNDLVYGKSISSSYPYGLFKVNDCRDGLLSTLYFTFKVNDSQIPAFLDRYFSYHNRANNFLKKYVLVGDRYITADANFLLSGKIYTPQKKEQLKIANFFGTLDKKIEQLKQKKSLLEEYKKGIMQKIFAQELRFKDENGNEFPDWEEKILSELLDYVQPTKYLVESTEYDDSYKTPVLTAGKSFILGYTNETFGIYDKKLPLIIFDDFTTAIQFVDFPFKAKSSAMKLLVPKKGSNIYFIFEAMQLINYSIGGHERHWISKYSKIEIPVPCAKEQNKISDFLSTINDKISRTYAQIVQTQQYKKGLLQNMFV